MNLLLKSLLVVIIVPVLLIISLRAYSQQFGVKAGMNISSMIFKEDNNTYSKDFNENFGYNFGVTTGLRINDFFAVESGVLFTTKGFHYTEIDADEFIVSTIGTTLTPYYIELPIAGKISYTVGGVNFCFDLGPYLSVGLAGKIKGDVENTFFNMPIEVKIKWGNKAEDHFKRIDYGMTAGAGVSINSIQLRFSYGYGLRNIASTSSENFKVYNRVAGVSVGYMFGF